MFKLNDDKNRQLILDSSNDMLIMGGPGAGKTTVALFKAKQIVESNTLMAGQKILFLSFARVTIKRVQERACQLLSKEIQRCVEINTYHGFEWNILKHHGYLLSKKPLKILAPYDTSHPLTNISKEKRDEEFERLFYEEGLLHFDVFATTCCHLLSQSSSIRDIICKMYPVIILDEFQDTNASEWELIQLLGKHSRIIALADPEQRIYDFRGADPIRILQFQEIFNPDIIDFGEENNRSNGTDIVKFGNDLLKGANRGQTYEHVKVINYQYRKEPNTFIELKYATLRAIKYLKREQINEWSIAILVPSKALMLAVSEAFDKEQSLGDGSTVPKIHHEVSIDMEGPSLAVIFIAAMLSFGSCRNCSIDVLLHTLNNYIVGRKGGKLTKADSKLVLSLEKYLKGETIRGKSRTEIVDDCSRLSSWANEYRYSGVVEADWQRTMHEISKSNSKYLQDLANDAKCSRLFRKGNGLNSELGKKWRNTKTYKNAIDITEEALVEEHFELSERKLNGIQIMTIHKSKGKEFDIVMVFEGLYAGRFIYNNEVDKARLNLRVAVTRAKRNTVIFTPSYKPCPLL